MRIRVEYGVACALNTYWPQGDNWMMHFRFGRWVLARRLAKESDEDSEMFGCGKHRVVRRDVVVP